MSITPYVSFNDGASRSTQNLSSAAWVIYDTNGELVDLQDIFVQHASNNVIEYSVVIELITEVIALDIHELIVNLDSRLVVLQVNGHYYVINPHILRMYLHVHLLEMNFYYITYQRIPKRMNTLIDAVANLVLDRHLRNL